MNERPLTGCRVAVTRAAGQADELLDRLRALGAEALACPTIAIVPPVSFAELDAALDRLASYDWLVVTSANAVRSIVDRLAARGGVIDLPGQLRVGAVGSATAEALRALGRRPDVIPDTHSSASLPAALREVSGRTILVARGNLAGDALVVALRQAGARVDAVEAYRTVPGDGIAVIAPLLARGAVEAIVFTSPSTMRYLVQASAEAGLPATLVSEQINRLAVVCIGPTTAAAVRRAGLRVDAVAREQTVDGLVEALNVAWDRRAAGVKE